MLTEGYCINLSVRRDRWHFMQKQVSLFPHGFRLHRFNAIVNERSPRLGCANSHISILNQASEENRDYIFVLEDDALLERSGIERLNTALDNIPSDWDVLVGGHYESEVININKSGISKSNFIQCTHCIIYRNTSYEHFRNYDACPLGIDDYISYLASTRKINLYLVNPSVATQKIGYSDIKNIYFDWNNPDAQMKNDYGNYRELFNALYNNNIEAMIKNANKVKNRYLLDQANLIIARHLRY